MTGAEPPLAKVIPFPPPAARGGRDSVEPRDAGAPGRVIRLSDYRSRRSARAIARQDPPPPDLAA